MHAISNGKVMYDIYIYMYTFLTRWQAVKTKRKWTEQSILNVWRKPWGITNHLTGRAIWRSLTRLVFDIKLLFSISLSSVFRKCVMSCGNWLRMERFPYFKYQIRKCNILEIFLFQFFYAQFQRRAKKGPICLCVAFKIKVSFLQSEQTNKRKRNEACLFSHLPRAWEYKGIVPCPTGVEPI